MSKFKSVGFFFTRDAVARVVPTHLPYRIIIEVTMLSSIELEGKIAIVASILEPKKWMWPQCFRKRLKYSSLVLEAEKWMQPISCMWFLFIFVIFVGSKRSISIFNILNYGGAFRWLHRMAIYKLPHYQLFMWISPNVSLSSCIKLSSNNNYSRFQFFKTLQNATIQCIMYRISQMYLYL